MRYYLIITSIKIKTKYQFYNRNKFNNQHSIYIEILFYIFIFNLADFNGIFCLFLKTQKD